MYKKTFWTFKISYSNESLDNKEGKRNHRSVPTLICSDNKGVEDVKMSVVQCVNITCTNDIPPYIIQQFRTPNDKRKVCISCRRKHIPIRVSCLECEGIFELIGHILRLYCSDTCRRDAALK